MKPHRKNRDHSAHDSYASLRFSAFRFLITARFLATFAILMIETVLAWHLYEKTGSKYVLGLLGLFEISPVLLLSLYAGQLADKHDRQILGMKAQSGFLVAGILLTLVSILDPPLIWFYLVVILMGTARAFSFPAISALLVRTVPPDLYGNAAAWSSNAWQLAAVLGPAFGGILIGFTHSPLLSYMTATVLLAIAIVCLSRLKLFPQPESNKGAPQGILEGFAFLMKNPLVFSVIWLDLFAVFFGGAVALLPVYAKDILKIGPEGLGWLRAAPSIGAVLTSLYIAHRPPFKRAGATLLVAVAGFGISTTIFGLSTYPTLSFFMLLLTGAFDSVSVVIRNTLLLVSVPDAMRGRVSAVNSIFVNSSNELGAFESGMVAGAFGTVFSVVSGGVCTLLIVIVCTLKFPQLRSLKKLEVNPH